MASGRVLIVHGSAGMRSSMTELLAREGLRVEAIDSTFHCMSRFVDEPAELVLLGLAGLHEAELDLVRALKRERARPRVLVTFPSPRRDMAVQALAAGADGYLLEPFYTSELVDVVRGQLGPRAAAEPSARLPGLAREVAHAINNPLQVLTLLLQKEKVTKKELMDALPAHLERIRTVVGYLKEFGSVTDAQIEEIDAFPQAEAAAKAEGVRFDGARAAAALIDARNYGAALRTLFAALHARAGGAELSAELLVEPEAVVVHTSAPLSAFEGEKVEELLEAVFVIHPEREALPGLALPRALLEGMGGALKADVGTTRVAFEARVPRGH